MSDRSSLLGPLTSAVLVLSAITGHFVVREHLTSHRPVAPSQVRLPLQAGQNIDARLWQDPLAAVLAAPERNPDTALPQLANELRSRVVAPATANELVVLPVLVPASSYAEDAEVRRRYRVAVVSALMSADYVPYSTEHVGAFDFQPRAEGPVAPPTTPIPYEWYRRSRVLGPDVRAGAVPDTVLVLWVPERTLGSDPLLGGEHVVSAPLTELVMMTEPTNRAEVVRTLTRRVTFSVIGPANSDTLGAMVRSLVDRRRPPDSDFADRKAIAGSLASRFGAPPAEGTRAGVAWSNAIDQLANKIGAEPPNDSARRALDRALRAWTDHRKRRGDDTTDDDAHRFLTGYLLRDDARDPAGARAGVRDLIIQRLSPRARIFSPRATVPDAHLLRLARVEERLGKPAASVRQLFGYRSAEANVDGRFERGPWREGALPVFSRTNCTDAALAVAALRELDRRGIGIHDDDAHIALIVERDSLYGRTVEHTFDGALEYCRAETTGKAASSETKDKDYLAALRRMPEADAGVTPWLDPKRDHDEAIDEHFEVFSYFRGIDGATPNGRRTTTAPGSSDSKDDVTTQLVKSLLEPGATLPANVSFGTGQFDRVLQLADTISRREANKGRFAAIGIIGSDIYDKLAILQALAPRFPDKVFFTTDLDARLVPNDLTPFTRNLVVVSGFGLELVGGIQRESGAFRDSYQCAIHVATLLGVGAPLDPDSEQQIRARDLNRHLAPRTFEIGRTRAIDLSALDATTALHPEPDDWFWNWRVSVLSVLYLLVGALLAAFAVRTGRRALLRISSTAEPIRKKWMWVGLGIMGALLVLCAGGMWDFHTNRRGEPFFLSQGVSMWPTEVVRIFATGAGIVLLWLGAVRIHRADVALGERFFPGAAPRQRLAWPRQLHWLARLHARITNNPTPPRTDATLSTWWHDLGLIATPGTSLSPREVWERYRTRGSLAHRAARIAPYFVLLLLIACVVLLAPPAPKVPFRGDLVYWLDLVIGFFGVVITLLLALAVADTARLSTGFVQLLGRANDDWPGCDALRDLRREHGIDGAVAIEHLRIEVMCQRTAAVGNLFWYPFAVMAAMVFGQFSTFDAWRWPMPFVVLMAAVAAGVLIAGVLLLRTMTRTRDRALERIHRRISELVAQQRPASVVRRHERMLTAAKELNSGSFGGLRSPLLDAVLVPSGGLAVLSLFELMALVVDP